MNYCGIINEIDVNTFKTFIYSIDTEFFNLILTRNIKI